MSKSKIEKLQQEVKELRTRIKELEQIEGERNRVQEALRQEREKAQKYLDIAGVIFLVIDADQRISLINKKGCQILGYGHDEAIGANWFDKFLPTEVREQARSIFRDLMAGKTKGVGDAENPVLTKTGRERLIAWHNTVIKDNQGHIIGTLSSGEDITERKQVEEALRQNEAKYRELFENANDLIQSVSPEGQFLYVNRAWRKTLGYNKKEILNLHLMDIIAEDYRPHCNDLFQQILSGKSIDNLHTVFISKKGKRIEVEGSVNARIESGSAISTRGIFRDVTKRVVIEEALRDSEERFRLIVEDLGEGISIVDSKERFLFANKSADEIFGLNPGQLEDHNLGEFTSPEQFNQIYHQTNLRHRGQKTSYELEIIRQDGEKRTVLVKATPQFKDSKYQGTIGIIRDITEEKRTAKVLRDNEERYRNIFETAGVSIWEEDFSEIKATLNGLQKQGITDLRRYIDKHPDFLIKAASQIKVKDINETTLRMFGAASKTEMLGSLEHIFVPETLKILKDEICAIAEGRAYFEGETINQTLQGESLNVLLAMTFPANPDKYDSVLVSMMDITDRKRAEQEISLQRARFQQLFENAPVGIALVDAQDNIQSINKAFESIFQYRADEVIGAQINDTVVPSDFAKEASSLSHAALDGASVQKETIRKRKDGSLVPVQVYGVPINLDGTSVGAFGMYLDISDRKQKEQKLEYVSTHDSLTGLFNRSYFELEMARLEHEKQYPNSIMVGDVDGLKNINDRLGHAEGDRLLKETAQLLKKAFRTSDIIARIGGDEFAILLPGADAQAAKNALERIVAIINHHNLENPDFPISISIGVATGNQRSSLTRLLQEADRLMYEEKAVKRSKIKQMAQVSSTNQ